MENNLFKSYRCTFCGHEKYYICAPFLGAKRNIIASNCPECELGSMVINIDDDTNFEDDFLDRYYQDMKEVLKDY